MGIAILRVDHEVLDMFAHSQPHALQGEQAHWQGDWWVQPETRYHIRPLLDAIGVPSTWKIVQRPFTPGIFHLFEWAALGIALTSEGFPEVEPGKIPPYITVVLRQEYDPITQRYTQVFDHLDMRELHQ